MSRYSISPEAKEDLKLIREYLITQGGKRLARRVLQEIFKAFHLLADHPGIGHVRKDLTAEPMKFWPVYSYLVVYDPARKPIGIAGVHHASQDLETAFRRKPLV